MTKFEYLDITHTTMCHTGDSSNVSDVLKEITDFLKDKGWRRVSATSKPNVNKLIISLERQIQYEAKKSPIS